MFFTTKEYYGSRLKLVLKTTAEANKHKGYVPAYYFDICLLDNTRIGCCDLRVGHNSNTYLGGNIGYIIDEAYRGNHYALEASQILVSIAQAHNLKYLMISCEYNNYASSKTCIALKAKFIEEVVLAKECKMYEDGSRIIKIFKLDI